MQFLEFLTEVVEERMVIGDRLRWGLSVKLKNLFVCFFIWHK